MMTPEERAGAFVSEHIDCIGGADVGFIQRANRRQQVAEAIAAAIHADRQERDREALAAAGVDEKDQRFLESLRLTFATTEAEFLLPIIDHLAAITLALASERDVSLEDKARVRELEAALLGLVTAIDGRACWCYGFLVPGKHLDECLAARKALRIPDESPT